MNDRERESQQKLKSAWLLHWSRQAIQYRKWARFEMVGPFWFKPLPAGLRGVTCGAKTRAGTPCKRRDLSHKNGRCRLHGGMSTGPKTAEGKARCAENGFPAAGGLAKYPMQNGLRAASNRPDPARIFNRDARRA
jgi:hypothetical protein